MFCLPGVLEDEISEERHTARAPPLLLPLLHLLLLLRPEVEVGGGAVTPDQTQLGPSQDFSS